MDASVDKEGSHPTFHSSPGKRLRKNDASPGSGKNAAKNLETCGRGLVVVVPNSKYLHTYEINFSGDQILALFRMLLLSNSSCLSFATAKTLDEKLNSSQY